MVVLVPDQVSILNKELAELIKESAELIKESAELAKELAESIKKWKSLEAMLLHKKFSKLSISNMVVNF